MGRQSDFYNFTIVGAAIEPVDLTGAKQVIITVQANSARLYGDAGCQEDYLPLDVTQRFPLVMNSTDGYLFLRNENQGGATDAFISIMVVR